MEVIFGVWLAVAGGVAALAGVSSVRRTERLRRTGATTWAVVVTGPIEPGIEGDSAIADRVMIQYALPDGRVIERRSPAPVRKARRLTPGDKVLIWYDPADPGEVLVFGREGRMADRGFVAVGSLVLLAGVLVAAIGR